MQLALLACDTASRAEVCVWKLLEDEENLFILLTPFVQSLSLLEAFPTSQFTGL